MFRQNSNCKAGYADLHLKWLLETQEPLQSAQQYPLLPEGSDPNPGECRRAYRPVYGYGADYYIHINKRQVRNGHSLSYNVKNTSTKKRNFFLRQLNASQTTNNSNALLLIPGISKLEAEMFFRMSKADKSCQSLDGVKFVIKFG